MPCSKSKDCSISGETCIKGICMCGSASSCEGKVSGSFCDASKGECRCSATLPSCAGNLKGSYCDVDQNVCKCSNTVVACTGELLCTDGECLGNFQHFHMLLKR